MKQLLSRVAVSARTVTVSQKEPTRGKDSCFFLSSEALECGYCSWKRSSLSQCHRLYMEVWTQTSGLKSEAKAEVFYLHFHGLPLAPESPGPNFLPFIFNNKKLIQQLSSYYFLQNCGLCCEWSI